MPKRTLKSNMRIIGNSRKGIAPSRIDILLGMAIRKIENGDNRPSLLSSEEEVFEFLCEEGIQYRNAYKQAETEDERAII